MAGRIQILSSGKNIFFHAKIFHCSCHPTWPPCKPSIVVFDVLSIYSHTVPTCASPDVPNHAYISYPRTDKKGSYLNGDRIYFSCERGYILGGIPFLECTGSQWTSIRFSCNGTQFQVKSLQRYVCACQSRDVWHISLTSSL